MDALVVLAAVFLAFVNGANDNLKGVATLYGAGVLGYRRAVALASASTALGALSSLALAGGLATAFSGRGIVPASAVTTAFTAAVGLAAAATVLLATRLGLPVSTTHALVGAIAGAGFLAAGSGLDLRALTGTFVLTLLLGPLVAVPLAALVYLAGRAVRVRAGIEATTCVCVGETFVPIETTASWRAAAAGVLSAPLVEVGTVATCRRLYQGRFVGVSAQALVDGLHLASASLVGFARGLNDTPKILGLLLGAALVPPAAAVVLLTVAMTLGGVTAGRPVLETLARRVTAINPGQGLAGNLVTSLLVTAGARFGWPLSTTHVSTGGIFGIGWARGDLQRGTVSSILVAWVTTVPLSALLAALALRALD